METEAVFENIASRIIEEIKKANNSIYIAVAWFTNKNIFEELILKSKNDCLVQIIISNDAINANSKINFDALENGAVFKVGNGNEDLMHNKFCVIDHNTVITGSYNWSYKAENNFENIVINSNNTALAEQFVKEFNQIKNNYFPNSKHTEIDFPIELIIKRLEIIKNLIVLEDIEDVASSLKKLSSYRFNSEINSIISEIERNEFSKSILLIQQFINAYQQLAIWNDPEIAGIRLEIKLLESQINAFDNEKIELEKILADFQHRHTIELGSLILEVLKLRKIKYKNQSKEAEANEDYDNFNDEFENEIKKTRFELNDAEKAELKKNFRKATTLCHPDKVSDEQKAEAEKIFIELKNAYDEYDVEKVNQILKKLQNGTLFHSEADKVSEKEKLYSILEQLKQKVSKIEKEIIILKESEVFITISGIQNMDNYFKETKIQLENELESLSITFKI